MIYRAGKQSIANLQGVDAGLILVVGRAFDFTPVDFSVFEGLRTRERQRELVRAGYSQTMEGFHLTGDAVDLVPYIDGNLTWENRPAFWQICRAVRSAAIELGVLVRWGGGWFVLNETDDLEGALAAYVERKRAEGKRPFLDLAHFQLATR